MIMLIWRLQCLKRDAKDRPSINKLLATPIIKQRIETFLGATLFASEFRWHTRVFVEEPHVDTVNGSHTIIHSNPAHIKPSLPIAAPAQPAPAVRVLTDCDDAFVDTSTQLAVKPAPFAEPALVVKAAPIAAGRYAGLPQPLVQAYAPPKRVEVPKRSV